MFVQKTILFLILAFLIQKRNKQKINEILYCL